MKSGMRTRLRIGAVAVLCAGAAVLAVAPANANAS
jgi:hypothetical protein